MKNSKCTAITKKQKQCNSYAMKESLYCYIHSFGKLMNIPWWKNSTIHFVITIFLAIIFFIYGNIIIPVYLNRKSSDEQNKNHDELIIRTDKIQAGLEEMLSRLDKTASKENIKENAKRTFEIGKNFNANFLLKKGYEKKGGMGTWFTPSWKDRPQNKFYLLDFVGNLDKNRISIFITEENQLIAQILTSDARKEIINVNIKDWKKDEPHLIVLQWDTDINRIQLYVDKILYEKFIPNLSFDILGPVVFQGIDFEGKYPGKFQRGGPKISEGLKSIGMKEYEKSN